MPGEWAGTSGKRARAARRYRNMFWKRDTLLWGTFLTDGAQGFCILNLIIVVLKRCSLLAMPFLLWYIPVFLNVLGTLLPFIFIDFLYQTVNLSNTVSVTTFSRI